MQRGVQLGGHEQAGRDAVLPAHARQVLRVLLAARRRDDQLSAADHEAEDFLPAARDTQHGDACLAECATANEDWLGRELQMMHILMSAEACLTKAAAVP